GFIVFTAQLGEVGSANFQNFADRLRSDGKTQFEVTQPKPSLLVTQTDFTALEHLSIKPSEHGEQDFGIQRRVGRVPVDVEVEGVARRGTFFEDGEPPLIGEIADTHVIRDNVKTQAQAVSGERSCELVKRRGPAEL